MISDSLAEDPRALAALHWSCCALQLPAGAQVDFGPASADASFRRYFRLEYANDSWIVMDAPPEREDCRPFLHVAGLMHEAGLLAPRVLAQDLERGYLLLSDLGRQTYLQVLDAHNADALFAAALEALARWQHASRPGLLPAYDDALLRRELALFPDWFVARHVQRTLTSAQAEALRGVEDLLVASALAQPSVFVHRDFMPRNLMHSAPGPGVLDFQDAVTGPATYDLISLFKDAFRSWPEERVRGWTEGYRCKALALGLPLAADAAEFRRQLDWMGLQRHLKVLGIFARIRYRDGKPHYLEDAPRFIRYVREVAARYPELGPLLRLFDELGLDAA